MRISVLCLGGTMMFSAALYAENEPLFLKQEESMPLSSVFSPVLAGELLNRGFSKEQLFRKSKKNKMKASYTGMIKHGHVQDPDLEWDWGYRTGVGYNTIMENWNVAATYTRFHTKVFASTKTPSGLSVPTWRSTKSAAEESEADLSGSAWRLHLDLADVEIGRSYEAREMVVLRPHLGLRGAWIYQKGKVDTSVGMEESHAKQKMNFFSNNCVGLGLRSGLDSLWNVGRGVSLFGDGALSLLAGYYNIDQKIRRIAKSNELLNEENRVSGGIATAEMSFGMQYEKTIFTRSVVVVRLGYEMNYVFNQTRWMDWFSNAKGALADAGSGMSLQGITLGLRLDY